MEGVVRGCCAGEKKTVHVLHASEMDRLWRRLEAAAWQRQNPSSRFGVYIFGSYPIFDLLFLYMQGLIILLVHTVLLVHTDRATQEVQPFDNSANSALHDREPLRDRDQTHVDEGLASIQTWTDLRTGSRCLYAVHLLVGASGRVFRIQHAQSLRPWIAVRGDWVDQIGLRRSRTGSGLVLTLRADH